MRSEPSTVEAYGLSIQKMKRQQQSEFYDYMLEQAGYGKYTVNKYVLKIKNKKDSKKQGWTFVTVAPTL